MEIAIISPVDYLQEFSTRGTFDFALAHVLVEERQRGATTNYRDYFLKQAQAGRVVFLDNGAHEESCVDQFTLCALARDIQATHVIAPDVVGDAQETRTRTEQFLSFLESGLGYTPQYRIIGVAQGKTLEEWLDSYMWLYEHPSIDTIAIPYDVNFLYPVTTAERAEIYVESVFGESKFLKQLTNSTAQCYTRMQLIQLLIRLKRVEKPIHLLGWSLPYENFFYRKNKLDSQLQLSNDSQGYCVYPIETNKLWIDELESIETKLPTPLDFWRKLTDDNIQMVDEFIENYLSLFNDELV